jgi:hypothetical protein
MPVKTIDEELAPATKPEEELNEEEVITGAMDPASPMPRPEGASELAPLPGAVLVMVTSH